MRFRAGELDARERRLVHALAAARGLTSESSGRKGRGVADQRQLTVTKPAARRKAEEEEGRGGGGGVRIVGHASELEQGGKGWSKKGRGAKGKEALEISRRLVPISPDVLNRLT